MPCQIKISLKDLQWFKGLVHFQNKNVLIIYSLVFLFFFFFFYENVPGYFSIYGTLMLANGLKVQIAISMVSTRSEQKA